MDATFHTHGMLDQDAGPQAPAAAGGAAIAGENPGPHVPPGQVSERVKQVMKSESFQQWFRCFHY